MAMIYAPRYEADYPSTTALRILTVQITRAGEATQGMKRLSLLDPDTQEEMVSIWPQDGESTTQTFAAEAVDVTWLVLTSDLTIPRLSDARYITIDSDVTLAIDIQTGDGEGGGLPATLDASVEVSKLPARRAVLAVEQQSDGQWRLAGSTVTDAQGVATLDLRVTGAGRVYAMAIDDWGVAFQPGLVVAVGTTIRPPVFTGWLYTVTEAGQLPAVEPEWWGMVGENPSRPLGTARAIATRYFRPLAHGPVPITIL